MQPHTPELEFANYSGMRKNVCPCCNANLVRTARRPIDRFLGLLVSLQRFRCTRFQCQWVGNIRMGEASPAALKNPVQLDPLR